MIFQHTIDKVLSGEKTQTRRVVDVGDCLRHRPVVHTIVTGGFASSLTNARTEVVNENGNLRWSVGGEYAVQPGRGMKGVGKIRITRIRRQNLKSIDLDDVAAELGIYPFCWPLQKTFDSFVALWDSIQPVGRRWKDNPEVWVLEFELVKGE